MSTIAGLTGSFAQTASMRGGGGNPPTFSSLDGDTSGGISLDELTNALSNGSTSTTKGVETLFKAMDADQDGSISESEKNDFDSALQDRMSTLRMMAQMAGQEDETRGAMSGPPPGPPPGGARPSADDMASTLMDAIDGDSDGSATLAEFTSAISDAAGSDAYSSDDIESAFSLLDADSDGTLTSTEMSEFLQAMQPPQQMAFGGPPPADWMQQANSAYATTGAVASTSYLAAA